MSFSCSYFYYIMISHIDKCRYLNALEFRDLAQNKTVTVSIRGATNLDIIIPLARKVVRITGIKLTRNRTVCVAWNHALIGWEGIIISLDNSHAFIGEGKAFLIGRGKSCSQ